MPLYRVSKYRIFLQNLVNTIIGMRFLFEILCRGGICSKGAFGLIKIRIESSRSSRTLVNENEIDFEKQNCPVRPTFGKNDLLDRRPSRQTLVFDMTKIDGFFKSHF